eukprot:g51632.t1
MDAPRWKASGLRAVMAIDRDAKAVAAGRKRVKLARVRAKVLCGDLTAPGTLDALLQSRSARSAPRRPTKTRSAARSSFCSSSFSSSSSSSSSSLFHAAFCHFAVQYLSGSQRFLSCLRSVRTQLLPGAQFVLTFLDRLQILYHITHMQCAQLLPSARFVLTFLT